MDKLKDILGYKKISPFKDSKSLLIKTDDGRITMKGVDKVLLGIGKDGEKKVMLPEKEYQFKSKEILEIPMMFKCGGKMKKYASGGTINGMNPEEFLSQSANIQSGVNTGFEVAGQLGGSIGNAIVPGLGTGIQAGTKLLQLGYNAVDTLINGQKRKRANELLALKEKDYLTQQINNKIKASVGYI